MRMAAKFKPRNITIPADLEAAMAQFPNENWSAVARRAFEARIQELLTMNLPNIYLPSAGTGLECRICGLHFAPDFQDDQRTHRDEHRKILRGGLPLHVRELLKGFGFVVAAEDEGQGLQEGRWTIEDGKRAVVFGWFARARSNGLPDDQLEPFMSAHFGFIDAKASKDKERLASAQKAIEPWERFAG